MSDVMEEPAGASEAGTATFDVVVGAGVTKCRACPVGLPLRNVAGD